MRSKFCVTQAGRLGRWALSGWKALVDVEGSVGMRALGLHTEVRSTAFSPWPLTDEGYSPTQVEEPIERVILRCLAAMPTI